MNPNILLIDDEESLRKLLSRIIELEGFTVLQAGSLKAGWKIAERENIDIVLCDVKLPDGNGVDFVAPFKLKYPLTEIVLLTAYGNISDGVTAIKHGALDYITKGDDNDRIIPLLHQAVNKVVLQRKKTISLQLTGAYTLAAIIGKSSVIQESILLAKKIAPTNINILLLGETGTGKEVFANAIHAESKRSADPFIAINCSAFTKELLEGELFGYKIGAFTGAIKDKKGLIELANKGTLFLDEIGEMNFELQAKLLRVLENGEFIKLGDDKTTKVDVRFIAATNKNLTDEVSKGNFREDLFYRLNGFTIHLPSLNNRSEDIPILAAYFVEKFAVKENITVPQIHEKTIEILKNHLWKGNIRELKNAMERACIMCDGSILLPEHLPFTIHEQLSKLSDQLTLASIEKNHIQKMLLYTKGNKTKAAELMGIGLTTLYRKIEEYHIPI